MRQKSPPQGFTLLEVQVAVVILLFAIAGVGVLTLNDMKQLSWLETRRQLYAYIPAARNCAVFTEITSDQTASPAVQRVEITEDFTVFAESMTATASIGARTW